MARHSLAQLGARLDDGDGGGIASPLARIAVPEEQEEVFSEEPQDRKTRRHAAAAAASASAGIRPTTGLGVRVASEVGAPNRKQLAVLILESVIPGTVQKPEEHLFRVA